ncbi:hypothetical protein SAMD00019534_046580 [Acytostelium subglobosum LB1]|uniref:hypothetical protein n=1 Tax=Acytostelium subglobosum LB1 TaxID=1410327 RepID=UPI000644FE95|nr:hypothetical protein SAMD00019534_046580 [Acytostelium subglobosum LB1]GAM21483.1 hypothetical protein SAMD00019534_046580 [Acytostelium subglobosum LB1]|eukprot:XP_012755602.1 hypothetical protein SAMD00019534_046580 [Acytostelium subglobosum LB1]
MSSISMKRKDGANNNTPVYLNIYDLHDVNNYLYNIGLGAYHSGVEVNGSEYSFGGHEYDFSGVFEIEPRTATGARFRERVQVGETNKTRSQVQSVIDQLSEEYSGNSYHTLQRNCNCFSQELVHRLTGNNIPNYVNRLANFGSLFSCMLPNSLLGMKTPTGPTHAQEGINSPLFPGKGYSLEDRVTVSASDLPTPPPLALSSSGEEDLSTPATSHALSPPSSSDNKPSLHRQDSSDLDERRNKMLAAANKRLRTPGNDSTDSDGGAILGHM